MRNTLLLFTGSYPYAVAAEHTFLPQEIAVLRRHFERVIVVPTSTGGARAEMAGANVEVDTSYAKYRSFLPRRAVHAVAGLADARFRAEVLPRITTFLRRPRGLVRTVRAYVDARLAERWIERAQGGGRFRLSDTVLCTWWFEGTTQGLGEFGRSAGVPVVTRAHGRDIYEWRQDTGRIAFRKRGLEVVQLVFSVSQAGARYLAERYPENAQKVRVARLGIGDPGVMNAPSADGVFRIMSCSVLLKVKRLDLMARGIAAAGRAYPAQRFEWTHVGDGDRASLQALADSLMPPNVTHRILPYPGQKGLYELYADNPVDVFMNTSESEGTPVAIMEAIAMGMPVIATSVGGNPEIVGPENGVTIPAHPEPREIADAIGLLLQDPGRRSALRAGSRDKWRTQYAADTNYSNFAEIIRAL